MTKPPLTEEKLNRVKFSLKKMSILAQVLLMENQTEIVDADFRIPNMNNFSKRILSDYKQLKSLIHTCVGLVLNRLTATSQRTMPGQYGG